MWIGWTAGSFFVGAAGLINQLKDLNQIVYGNISGKFFFYSIKTTFIEKLQQNSLRIFNKKMLRNFV